MTERGFPWPVHRVWFGDTAAIGLDRIAFTRWEDIDDDIVTRAEREAEKLKPETERDEFWLVVHLIDQEEVISLTEQEGEDLLRAWNAYAAGGSHAR